MGRRKSLSRFLTSIFSGSIIPNREWACSAVGSASHSHCGGRGFESLQVHQRKKLPSGSFFLWYDIYAEEIRTIKCRCPVDICLIPARRDQHHNVTNPFKSTRNNTSLCRRHNFTWTLPKLHKIQWRIDRYCDIISSI